MDEIAVEKFTALTAVIFIAIFTLRWILGAFVERLKAIETAIDEVNDAVNHRHERDNGNGRKLYDLALENNTHINKLRDELSSISEWRKSYLGGPLDTGQKVIEFVSQMANCAEKIDAQYEDLKQFAIDMGCPLKGGKKTDKKCQHDNPQHHCDPPDDVDRQQDY